MKRVIVKILWLPALWSFFWAIYPLAFPRDFILYLMLSLLNWLYLGLSIIGAVILEILITDSNMRKRLRDGLKFARAPMEPTSKTSKKPRKSAKKEEEKLPLY